MRLLNVLTAVSEWERQAIGERTRTAFQGEAGGIRQSPFGFCLADGGRLVPDPDEQATLAADRELREPGLSLRAIRLRAISLGCESRTGATVGFGAGPSMLRGSASERAA